MLQGMFISYALEGLSLKLCFPFDCSTERNTALATWGVVHLHGGGDSVASSVKGLALLRLLLHGLLLLGGSLDSGLLLSALLHGLVATTEDVELLVTAGLVVNLDRSDTFTVSALLHFDFDFK